MKRVNLFIVIVLLFVSCDFFDTTKNSGSKEVARVYDEVLYQSDLERMYSKNTEAKDSVLTVRELINSWAKQKLLLYKSELNLPEENNDLELLVKKYREDLFINSFKDALIAQRLDTVVAPKELLLFYEANKESFKLREMLLQVKFMEIDRKSKNTSLLKRLFLSNKEEDSDALTQHEDLKAINLNDSVWIPYKKVLHNVSFLQESLQGKTPYSNYLTTHSTSNSISYFYVKKVKKPNEIAPFDYIAPSLKQMVLHKRKLKLIKKVEEVLVDDAIKNKQFEIY